MRIRFSSLVAASAVALALAAVPNLALAQAKSSVCKDGTTSTAGKGACSGHGGVDAAKTKAAVKAAPAATKPATKSATTPPVATAAATKSAPAAKKDVASKSAASGKDATGATAQCKDGTYSHAASHSGACSKHGGVAKFLK
ncbi:MAG TPA: DUF3761 domain-containing protein [Gemmatimonadaceae bacterium]|jgi:hypothetical protein